MSRRGKLKTTPDRKSLLKSGFSSALSEIHKMRYQTVRTMTSYAPSAVDTLKMLWPEQVLEDCRRGRVVTSESVQHCGPYPFAGAMLYVNFRDVVTDYLPPKAELMGDVGVLGVLGVHDEVSFGPSAKLLLDFIGEIDAITLQFAVVEHVLRWMDERATANAVRHYWPSIFKLAPHCRDIQEAGGDNFREPDGLWKVAPLLRSTAATVASAAFLKKDDGLHTEKGLSLSFQSSRFMHQEHLSETWVQSPAWTYSF